MLNASHRRSFSSDELPLVEKGLPLLAEPGRTVELLLRWVEVVAVVAAPVLVVMVVVVITVEGLEAEEGELREVEGAFPVIEAALMVLAGDMKVCNPKGPLVTLSGTARTYIVPALARVDVTVVAPVIVVPVAAKDEPILCTLAMTPGATGTPLAAHVSATGPTKDVALRLLSQFARIQVMTLTRKLPFDRRQRPDEKVASASASLTLSG